jgi:hypothetical protein
MKFTIKQIKMDKDKDFKKAVEDVITVLGDVKYSGDLSDLGNEIGFAIGEYIKDNEMGFTLDDFIAGLKHGVSIVNGTHP